ncbi:hypothetical protein [Ancylobacter polymorphus]|uniref:Uncharacterized protein n=1 Tax=Ancylobacter polymorphus TaxID=223390 RepID=A0A9E7A1S6_9HYPH|nr:hypothetical protein [Ancylobacter polymorphus]UOK71560.1 hypothetical protein K9D25_02220 [Ancylobacter polymorphus]
MAIDQGMFDVFTVKDAEGRPGIKAYVQLKKSSVPKGFSLKGDLICLTADAVSESEFSMHVDELIDQLTKLKPKAAACFRREREQRRRGELSPSR